MPVRIGQAVKSSMCSNISFYQFIFVMWLLCHNLSDGTASASHYTQIRARKGNSLSLSAPCRSYSTMIPACQTPVPSTMLSTSRTPPFSQEHIHARNQIARHTPTFRWENGRIFRQVVHITILIKCICKNTQKWRDFTIFAVTILLLLCNFAVDLYRLGLIR